MSKNRRAVSRILETEVVPTHETGFSILYARWSDEPKTLNHIIGHTDALKKMEVTIKHPKLEGVPVLSKGKNLKYMPHFLPPEAMERVQKNGGLTQDDYDLFNGFKPKVWGAVPPTGTKLYGVCHYNGTYIHPDGTYAVTAQSDNECWSNWKRKKVTALLDDPNIPINRTGRDDYYVPGNGEMFDWVFTFTQEQFVQIREFQDTVHWGWKAKAFEMFGLNEQDYRKD